MFVKERALLPVFVPASPATSMNDFVNLMNAFREAPVSLGDIAVKLASTPCSPIGMKYPADVVLEMMAGGT